MSIGESGNPSDECVAGVSVTPRFDCVAVREDPVTGTTEHVARFGYAVDGARSDSADLFIPFGIDANAVSVFFAGGRQLEPPGPTFGGFNLSEVYFAGDRPRSRNVPFPAGVDTIAWVLRLAGSGRPQIAIARRDGPPCPADDPLPPPFPF